jgi:hypothetical protein
MAHTEFGFQVVQKFLSEIAPYGHQDFAPKLIGRGINVMISPLPRNKRAKHPQQPEAGEQPSAPPAPRADNNNHHGTPVQIQRPAKPQPSDKANDSNSGNFANNPFAQLEINR